MKIIQDLQFIRYLIVGAWNTLFGYGLFALMYFLLSRWVNYIIIAIACNIVAITVAYAGYKLFVFRTKGNYLKEYLRFYVIYGFTMVLGLVLLPVFVEIFKLNVYLAQAIAMMICIGVSFIGHRNYSFKTKGSR